MLKFKYKQRTQSGMNNGNLSIQKAQTTTQKALNKKQQQSKNTY